MSRLLGFFAVLGMLAHSAPAAEADKPPKSALVDSSEIVGTEVHDLDRKPIGEFVELVASKEGRILYAIVADHFALTLATELRAIPYEAMSITISEVDGQRQVNATVSEAALKALRKMPPLRDREMTQLGIHHWRKQVASLFKVDPPPETYTRADLFPTNEIVAASVHDMAGKELGAVDYLLVDQRGGSLGYVVVDDVISLVDSNLIPVPFDCVACDRTVDGSIQCRIDPVARPLRKAPTIAAGDHSPFEKPEFVENVEGAFHKQKKIVGRSTESLNAR
ncbi:PRC-barrel domain protein [Planctomycetes bacterium Pan216]|uniref:PRC-barrel domain protein n=1 Tax=Kolteria novifilia TaxID=2527975 RepID=A0A518B4U7_9BACT|nr:PRC-barrel domain protein [Planctomycetes bacterium Pan216]